MKPIFTVSEVTNIIKNLFDSDDLFNRIYIKGEISNFRHHTSGHMYFTLKDKGSQIRCVMFKSNNIMLPFTPENGMNVVAFGFISVFAKSGEYQLYVENLQPDGIGALHIAFERLKIQLKKEGLFSPERKLPIPSLPRKIGLITSPTGAAIKDLLTTIKRRFNNVDIIIAPVLVQGKYAASEICSAISRLNSLKDLDVIIIGRGGGSIEELWAFNEEVVARSIANSKIPIITAIGHETDYTIADFVADKRAPTPSTAGEIVVPEKQILKRDIRHISTRLTNVILYIIGEKRQKIEYLKKIPIFSRPETYLINRQLVIDQLLKKLLNGINDYILKQKTHLKHHVARLEALSPLSTLKRGYSICTDANTNKVIKQSASIKTGDLIIVLLADGSLLCNVIDHKGKDDAIGFQL